MMAFWLLLSGHYDLFHITLGVISVFLVMLFNYRLKKHRFVDEGQANNIELKYYTFIYYIPWLFWQLIKSGVQVALIVIKPKMPIDPVMIKIKTDLPSATSRVILANSITLTPGTLTVTMVDNDLLIHTLIEKNAGDITDSYMPDMVGSLYGVKGEKMVAEYRVYERKKTNTG